jgi:hypothetical protein
VRRRIVTAVTATVVVGLAVALVVLARADDDHTLARIGLATLLALVLVGQVGGERGTAARFAFAGAAVFWLASVAHAGATSGVASWLAGDHLGEDPVPFPRLAAIGSLVSVLAFLLAVGAVVWIRLGPQGRRELVARVSNGTEREV